jgi:ferric-dicitrate binding protein FerR (iron transport regulator)
MTTSWFGLRRENLFAYADTREHQMNIGRALVTRRAVFASTAACLISRAAFGAPSAAGLVTAVVGQGFAEAGAAHRDLEQNSQVFIGDLVGTGSESRLAIRLGEVTQLKLGADVRVLIDSFIANAGGVLELRNGPLQIDSDSRRLSRGLSIRSPFGSIAVRGTHFFAGPSNGVFGIFVFRGSVRVTAAGRVVTVTEGKGTNIERVGSRPTVPAAWGEARIRQAVASTE